MYYQVKLIYKYLARIDNSLQFDGKVINCKISDDAYNIACEIINEHLIFVIDYISSEDKYRYICQMDKDEYDKKGV